MSFGREQNGLVPQTAQQGCQQDSGILTITSLLYQGFNRKSGILVFAITSVIKMLDKAGNELDRFTLIQPIALSQEFSFLASLSMTG